MPTGLRTDLPSRRPRLWPALVHWATIAMMAGTAGLGLQLVRSVSLKAAELRSAAAPCGTVAPRSRLRPAPARDCSWHETYRGM